MSQKAIPDRAQLIDVLTRVKAFTTAAQYLTRDKEERRLSLNYFAVQRPKLMRCLKMNNTQLKEAACDDLTYAKSTLSLIINNDVPFDTHAFNTVEGCG